MENNTGKILKVFLHHAEHTAVGFYRIIQPSQYIVKNKLASIVNIQFQPESKNPIDSVRPSELEKVIKWADVAMFSRFDNPAALAIIKSIKGTYHIPVLMEMDDLPMELNSDSKAFSLYRQDVLMDSADAAYWSIKHMEISDGIFTTGEYLKAKIQRFVPKTRVHIAPNCIDLRNFKDKKTKKKGEIRIGWAGGDNHLNDLDSIKPVIIRLLKEYPHVRFITFGLRPPWTRRRKGCIHEEWVSFDKYYEKLQKLDFDIGVAPLIDNEFNRCKSNLRWLEWSAMGIPTVASRVVPFQCIRPNIDGYLAKNEQEWYAHLRALIERPKLRERIGTNARRTIKRNYNPSKWARYYVKIFNYYATKYRRNRSRVFRERRDAISTL